MTEELGQHPRRDFLGRSMVGAGAALAGVLGGAAMLEGSPAALLAADTDNSQAASLNMIGAYGEWAAQIVGDQPARLSFLQSRFQDVAAGAE